MSCTLKEPHDCATVRAANAALRRHLDRACTEVTRLREGIAAEADLLRAAANEVEEGERRDRAELTRFRAAAQNVVDQYDECRRRNSGAGLWSAIDDLAALLDGRAAAQSPAAPNPVERLLLEHQKACSHPAKITLLTGAVRCERCGTCWSAGGADGVG